MAPGLKRSDILRERYSDYGPNKGGVLGERYDGHRPRNVLAMGLEKSDFHR